MSTLMAGTDQKQELLEQLGLTQNDSKVYLTLLKEGTSTITAIAKKSGLYRPNIYEAINRLKSKGLVSEHIESTSRKFKAADPSALVTLLQEKELRLKSLLPQFSLDYQLSKNTNMVEVYEGAAATRNLFQHCLELGKDIYAFGLPKPIIGVLGEYFQNNIHQKRIQKKQWMYHIYNSDAADRMKYLNSLAYTEARHLSPEFNGPVATIVCGGEVSIISLDADKPTIIVIKNTEMAKAYQKYFAVLWEKAKK